MFDSTLPPMCLAVCVCGKNDWETEYLLPVAVACFRRQTYPANRRLLLLVTEAENGHKIAHFKSPDTKILVADGQPSLGALRNVAIRFAADHYPDAYMVQWDADDWHAVERIDWQMRAAMSFPGAACCLKRQIAYAFSRNVAFVREIRLWGKGHPAEGDPTPLHGTICHPVNSIRYPDVARGEDTAFFMTWGEAGVAEYDNPAELYIRFAHGNSTSGESHIMQGHVTDPPNTWNLNQQQANYLQQVLAYYRV